MKGGYLLFAGIIFTALGMTFWHGWPAGLTTVGVFWVIGGALLIWHEAREKLAKRAIMSAVEQDKFWSEQLGREE